MFCVLPPLWCLRLCVCVWSVERNCSQTLRDCAVPHMHASHSDARYPTRSIHSENYFTKQYISDGEGMKTLDFFQFCISVSHSFDLRSLFHQRGQGVTLLLLHIGSLFWLGSLIISNTVKPDEDHSPSCSTYLICSICIPSTEMIFGRFRSRQGSYTSRVEQSFRGKGQFNMK